MGRHEQGGGHHGIAVNVGGHQDGRHVQITDGHYHHHGWYSHRRNGCNACGSLFCLLIVAAVIACTFVLNPTGRISNPILSGGEQSLLCVSSTWRSELDVTYDKPGALVYLTVQGTPDLKPEPLHVNVSYRSLTLYSGQYDVRSFFLNPGSNISWNIDAAGSWFFSADFYLIYGETEYNKFKQSESFDYVYWTTGRYISGSQTVSQHGEYFVVIEAHEMITLKETFNLSKTMYDTTTSMVKICSENDYSNCKIKLPSNSSSPCLVTEVPLTYGAYNSISIDIISKTKTTYWIVCGIVCGVSVLVCFIGVISIIVCKVRSNNQVNYQQISPPPPTTVVYIPQQQQPGYYPPPQQYQQPAYIPPPPTNPYN